MDAEAQNSVLSKVHILVAKHLLFRFGVDRHKEGGKDVGQKHLRRHPRKRQFRLNNVIFDEFIVEGFEVFAQYRFIFIIFVMNGLHIIAGKGAWENMNEVEEGFKGFIQKMCEVILNLLCPLNIHNFVSEISQTIHFLRLNFFLLFSSFNPETHIATDPSNSRIGSKVMIHRKYGLFLRFEPNIHKDHEIRLQFLTEAVEKPIMR
jgi:hypothetical protein